MVNGYFDWNNFDCYFFDLHGIRHGMLTMHCHLDLCEVLIK
jgi:hypothetical protein